MPRYAKPKLLPSNNHKRTPSAIEDLAVLPVFYKLRGKKAVLAGGTAAAAWKAQLLAASGAKVHVYATDLSSEFEELLSGPRQHLISVHKRPWDSGIFEHASIAIADAHTKGEAQAFYCASKKAGVPVNVIDRPAFCEFQFGSIVNRSPAIVSISTNGAAPILGQAIRQRIETLLPKSLKDWAQFALDIRQSVTDSFSSGRQRRSFWERLARLAFTRPFSIAESEKLFSDIEGLNTNSGRGQVTLVGAGPGDAEMLTLKAMRALQAADVILFDDLVSDEVLELSRREAKKMLVGKRGGRTSCRQEDINEMMVSFAKAGKNVVRLKSGDPVIFGRAGEEIAELEANNIPVSIIPGITSGSAMAAELGVSLTHRDHTHNVRFVTGHSKNGKLPTDINWRSIADETASTIFYMGGRTACQIQNKLQSLGVQAETPIAICASVSRQNQKVWRGTLAELSRGINDIGYDDPVLIGVGEVFRLKKTQEKISPNLVVQPETRQLVKH